MRRRSRRSLRRHASQHRGAHERVETAGRPRARAAAQEDAWRRGVRGAVAALRRRGEPQEPGRRHRTSTTAMLMRGTRKHTRQQLSDEFDRLKARVNFNSWGSAQYAGIETTRENLPAVLTLLAEVLREPAFDPKELEQLRAEWLAGIEQQRSDPSALAFTPFQQASEAVSQGRHPLRRVDRREHRRHQGGHARAGAAVSPRLLRRAAGAGRGGRRLRRRRHREAGGDIVRRAGRTPKPFTRVENEYFDVQAAAKTSSRRPTRRRPSSSPE